MPETGGKESKEVLKESTNKLNTANGINGTNISAGNSVLVNLNGALNGSANGAPIGNGALNGSQTTNGSALVNGALNGHELDCSDENEQPKKCNGTASQTTKKPRLQTENDKVSVIDKLNIYVDCDAPCALFFTSVRGFRSSPCIG